MVYGPPLMDDLDNYKLREKIMYAATSALNNLTMYGRKNGDWGVHSLGHVLSVLYDVPHGATLSILFPAWMKLLKDKAGDRIIELGMNLFDVDTVDETIFEMEQFFASVECPIRLSDVNIDAKAKGDEIVQTMIANECGGNHYKLGESDYRRLIELMR